MLFLFGKVQVDEDVEMLKEFDVSGSSARLQSYKRREGMLHRYTRHIEKAR